MKRFLLVVGVCLLLPAGAGAHTTITSCDLNRVCPALSLPYQQWVDEAKVPTPDVVLTVRENVDGCAEANGCANGSTIWVAPFADTAARKAIFFHELGHSWAYWDAPSLFRDETFADEYSTCARARHVYPRWLYNPGNSGAGVRGRRVASVCRWIRRF